MQSKLFIVLLCLTVVSLMNKCDGLGNKVPGGKRENVFQKVSFKSTLYWRWKTFNQDAFRNSISSFCIILLRFLNKDIASSCVTEILI